MIKVNKKFVISFLDNNVNGEIIKTFEFKSPRDTPKFKHFKYQEIEGRKVLDDTLGYMVCDLVDVIDCDTHNIFIGKLKSSKRLNNRLPMTYQYYGEHKDEILKVKTENNTFSVS